MKKLSQFIIITVLIINCVSAFGAEINIKTAVPQENGYVAVEGVVLEPSQNQILTIMSTECTTENEYDLNSIVYIDQLNSKIDENGNFNISFLPAQNIKNDKLYCVRIGGTNITEPAFMLIMNTAAIPIGDADGNGIIDTNDAIIVLESVQNNTTEILSDKVNVTGSKSITANDAAYILKKVIDPNFVFPVEYREN